MLTVALDRHMDLGTTLDGWWELVIPAAARTPCIGVHGLDRRGAASASDRRSATRLTAYVTAYAGQSVARQDTLWHKRVRPLNIGGPSRPVVTRSGKTGQFPLNPKVQGSIPCASTNMLCPRASGRALGVPDVSTGGGSTWPGRLLTAYLTAYRSGNKPQNCRRKGFAYN